MYACRCISWLGCQDIGLRSHLFEQRFAACDADFTGSFLWDCIIGSHRAGQTYLAGRCLVETNVLANGAGGCPFLTVFQDPLVTSCNRHHLGRYVFFRLLQLELQCWLCTTHSPPNAPVRTVEQLVTSSQDMKGFNQEILDFKHDCPIQV